MREIGSEFWKEERRFILRNEELYLSGRTALDVIVKDAVRVYGIESALLPSYCCHTMIEPFLHNGISVRFYDVYVGDGGVLTADMPEPQEKEALYIMKYFGSAELRYEGAGSSLAGWAASIEDLTHRCFCEGYASKADYWFTSYRKWFAVDGIAAAGKRNGRLPPAPCGPHTDYCDLRNRAFSMKGQYMSGRAASPDIKQDYLDVFSQAEDLLSEDYEGYGADPGAIYDLFRFLDGIEEVRRKRRENAALLINGLRLIRGIKVIDAFSGKGDCPLFVPLLVESGERDALRWHLISKNIYCPIHWPLSEMYAGISDRAKEIYAGELSLVCDQRYAREDMERIIREIRSFFVETKR